MIDTNGKADSVSYNLISNYYLKAKSLPVPYEPNQLDTFIYFVKLWLEAKTRWVA